MNMRAIHAAVIATAALVSIASSASIASAQQPGADAGFATRLAEAADAARNHVPAGMGRTEQLIVDRYLTVAQDLYRQGRVDQAQGYLNFARGELGLLNSANAVASTSQMVSR